MRRFFIYFSLFTGLFLVTSGLKAQDADPACDPTVTYLTADTTEWRSCDLGSSISGSAPIDVQFAANPSNTSGWNEYYEWRFTKEGETEPFVIRYEQDTEYEFLDSKSISVSLYYLFTHDGDTISDTKSITTVTAYESQLEFPNAFSPNNGDDYNNIYKAKKYKSIIEFHAYIFNRWGQKLFDWSDPDEGWDGTYNGKDVKEGVYYVLVKAKGADGRKFTIKKDVNLLRGYREGTSNSSSSSSNQ